MARDEAPVEPDHERDTRRLDRRHGLVDQGVVEADRLLAEDRLPGGRLGDIGHRDQLEAGKLGQQTRVQPADPAAAEKPDAPHYLGAIGGNGETRIPRHDR